MYLPNPRSVSYHGIGPYSRAVQFFRNTVQTNTVQCKQVKNTQNNEIQ